MSILPSGFFGRRHEPPRHQVWDPYQDQYHGLEDARSCSTYMHPFPSETVHSAPIVNAHIEWKETPEAHVYKAHLPGLNHNDVRVELDDDRVLCIICDKREEKQEQRGAWHRVELSSGHFVQRLTLPENSKVEHVKAHMDNEVLTITVPKHRVMNNHHVRNINISRH